jgi:hypothetical protein
MKLRQIAGEEYARTLSKIAPLRYSAACGAALVDPAHETAA